MRTIELNLLIGQLWKTVSTNFLQIPKNFLNFDFTEILDATPFGKLPVLEYDGKMLCESIAICRFLAKENGLTGSDNWTAAEADMVVDSIMDMTYRG